MVDAAADDAHGSAAPGGTADAAADAAAAVRPETPPTDDTDLPGMAARDTMDQSDGAGGLAVPSAALYSPTAITRTQVPGSAKLEPPGRPAEVEPQPQDGVAVAQRKMRLEADDAALIPAASRCSGTTATQAYQEAPGGAARTPFERTPSYSALVRPLAQRDWKRDRGSVDLELARLRSLIALAGIMGALLAVIQEELVQTGREPYSTPLNVLKIGNMLCSLCLVALLVRYYMMWELFERIVMHLTALHPLDTRVPTSSVYSSWWFRAEAMFFGVFLPPFCSFELTTTNWDNILVYRAETIFAVINSFRVLLVWPILKNKILVSLPRRHTIAGFSNIKMGNAFAFKVLLNNESFALRFIGCVWALSFLLCAFWFRAAESSACLVISVETNLTMASSPECKKPNARLWSLVSEHGVNATTATDNRFEKINDLYLWNALWAMFVTSTSLGYGDILSTTHFGRVVCLVSALTGLVCAATLTAALSVVLTWTDDEMSAMLMVRREQAKLDLYKHSEGLIRNWMRNYLHKKKRLVNHYGVTVWRPDLKLLRQTFEKKQLFRRAKVATLVSLDDCQADGKKFELIFQATRYVMEAMSEVESKVRELTQEQPHDSPSSPSEFSRKDTNTSMLVPAPLVHADDASFLIRRAIDKAHKHRHTTQPSHKILEREDDIFESATQERKRTEEALEERIAAETADGRPKDIVSLVRQAAEVHRSGTGFDAHKNDWRRSRSALSRRENQSMIAAAVFGLSGTLCAIAQTEWVFLNQDPRALPCTLFKLFNTVLTILCLMSLYRVYSMSIWMTRLHKHLSHGRPFDPVITVSCVLQRWKFLLEVVICILHVPPFSTGESSLRSLDNIIVYRYEVLGCLANLLRIYLLWRPFQRWMISDIPSRNKIAGISGIQFGSLFVIKRMVNSWNSVAYVALAWFVSVIFFGYLLRITEITSCRLAFSENAACLLPSSRTWVIYGNEFEKTNDFMAWNGMWLVFVTMSTVGYGDTVPTTHLGRLVCALATLVGIGLASLITAALANMMKFNSYEEAALAVVRREQSRIKLRETAATIIILWWKTRKNLELTRKQEELDAQMLRKEFLQYKLDTMQEVEDLQNMSHKLDRVAHRFKLIESKIEEIAMCLWNNDGFEEMEKKWTTNAINDFGRSWKGQNPSRTKSEEASSGPTWSRTPSTNQHTVGVNGSSFGCADASTDATAAPYAGSLGMERDAARNLRGRVHVDNQSCQHIRGRDSVRSVRAGEACDSATHSTTPKAQGSAQDTLPRPNAGGRRGEEQQHLAQQSAGGTRRQAEHELMRLLGESGIGQQDSSQVLALFQASLARANTTTASG